MEIGFGLVRQGDTLELGFARGAASVTIYTPKSGPRASGEGLRALGERRLPGGMHLAQQLDAPPAAGRLALRLEGTVTRPTSDAKLTDSRLWIEMDDALAEVNEVHRIETDGTAPLESTSGGPLVCIGLPEGASELRFSNEALELGLSRDPSGALAIHGPLPPGTSTLALRYELPTRDGRAVLDRTFESELPLLSILIADTGLVPRTDRLHRKRAVRSQDRNYLHLEGFAIGADEPIALTVEPLESRGRWPGLASSGVLFALALASLAFLSAPLRASTPEAPPRSDEISTERAALYAAIDALDEDFETGKLEAEDHARMRDELRARAAQLLAAERAKPEPEPAAPPACPACNAELPPDARFCAQCGKALGEPEQSGS